MLRQHINIIVMPRKKILLDNTLSQELFIRYTKDNMSLTKLSETYKIPPTVIKRTLKEQGTTLRTHRQSKIKYTFNHNFFEIIDTEYKAYFLGFMLADGHVGEKEVIIAIKDIDRHIIEKFVKCIEGNNKICTPSTKSNFVKTETKCARINLRSDKMISDLNKLGLTRNKTYNTIVPSVPTHLERHFWRGVFDGDGYVSVYKTKQRQYTYTILETGLCGHINTMTAYREFLISNNIKVSKISPDKSIFQLRVCGANNALKQYDLLYTGIDPELCLKRKREKFELYKEYKEVKNKP